MSQFGKIADQPFSHDGRFGTTMRAARCDLRGGVTVIVPPNQTSERLASDMMQIGAFHAANILPNLNGFSGYDTVQISVVDKE